jgi:hypothetical protein
MLNKSVILTEPRARLGERRRWDRQRPLPEWRGTLPYRHLTTVVLAISVLYSVAIVLGLGVPSLDSFPVNLSTPAAVVMDLVLLFLAAMHFHFVQRPDAVLSLPQLRGTQAMRSQDRLLVSALLLAFFFAWQPLPDLIWALRAPSRSLQVGWFAGLFSLSVSAVLIEVPWVLRMAVRAGVLCCTCATRVARAGIIFGLLLVEWCTAQMNLGHLLFAGALTAYLGVAFFLYRRNVNVAHERPNAMKLGL